MFAPTGLTQMDTVAQPAQRDAKPVLVHQPANHVSHRIFSILVYVFQTALTELFPPQL